MELVQKLERVELTPSGGRYYKIRLFAKGYEFGRIIKNGASVTLFLNLNLFEMDLFEDGISFEREVNSVIEEYKPTEIKDVYFGR